MHNIYDPKFDSSSEDIQQDLNDKETEFDFFNHSRSSNQIVTDLNKNPNESSRYEPSQQKIENETPMKIEELNSYREPYQHISLFK